MGLDLKLLPIESDHEYFKYSHTILSVFRRKKLFEDILNIEAKEIYGEFSCYLSRNSDDETCYGEVSTDNYGEKLRYLYASELMKFKNHKDVFDNSKNIAIWAYLNELETHAKIVLFWE